MLFQLNISSMSFAIVVLKYKCTRLVSQKENYNGYNLLSKIHKTVDLSEDNCTGDLFFSMDTSKHSNGFLYLAHVRDWI